MRETNGMQIMNRLEFALSQCGKRKIDLVNDLNLPSAAFANWRQRGTIPNADVIFNIADYLHISAEWLTFGTVEAESEEETRIKNLVSNFSILDDRDKENIELVIESFLKRYEIQNPSNKVG